MSNSHATTTERPPGRFAALARALLAGEIPPPPISRLIGLRLLAAKQDSATLELDTDLEKHANPMGTLHGGILCDLSDAAMGFAYASQLEDDDSFTTLELKINFLRPVWQARLTATARVVQRGRSIGLVECDVTDDRGRLVARASSTCMTLRGTDAHGR